MRIPRPVVLGAVVAIGAAGLAACASSPGDDDPTSITIAIPSGQFIPNFEPLSSPGLFWTTVQPVYDSLVRWDIDDNRIIPWLAEEFALSEDGLTLSLTLREGITFTDGEPLTAEGVAEAFNYHMTEEGYFLAVTGELQPVATATGELTLDIVSKIPSYDDSQRGILAMLLLYPVVSPAAYDDIELLKSEPVGSGPYVLEEVQPEVSATYVRNPDYWNPDAYDFDEVKIVAYADKVAAVNALKSGQIDATEIDYGLAGEVEASGFELYSGAGGFNRIAIYDLTGEKFPALGDVRVRQAMNMAFDREAISEELERGFGHVSSQPFVSTTDAYVEGGDDRYPYDPERARELLAEAGYPDGFTLPMPAGTVTYNAVDYSPVITQYLGEIGITVEWITFAEGADAQKAVQDLVVGAGAAFDTFGNFPWAFLFPRPIESEGYDELYAQYLTGTPEEHADATEGLAELILDEAWFVPFSQPQVLWATTSDVLVTPTDKPVPLPSFDWFKLAD